MVGSLLARVGTRSSLGARFTRTSMNAVIARRESSAVNHENDCKGGA